jgi:hypothetical protein
MFLYCIEGLWATHQTEKLNSEEQNEEYARTTIRELTIYMVFLGILTIGKSNNMKSKKIYYLLHF